MEKEDGGLEDEFKKVTVAALSDDAVFEGGADLAAHPKLASVQGLHWAKLYPCKMYCFHYTDDMLTKAVQQFKGKNWKKIAEYFPRRSDVQCLHRWQKVLNPDLVKGPWTKEEDDCIMELVKKHGSKKWSVIAQSLPGRIGKQCRERWHNHLNPAIKKHAWTKEEELALIRAHQIYGNKWAEIAKFLPGRADNSIKNHWNCSVKKKLDSYLVSGFDGDLLGLNSYDFYNLEMKANSVKVNVSNSDAEIVCSHNPKEESDDGVDTSLVVSVFGISDGERKDRQSHSQPIQVENSCLKEEIDSQEESLNGNKIECRSPIPRGMNSEFGGEDADYASTSEDFHHSIEMDVSRGISSYDSMMIRHSRESTCVPLGLSINSPRHPGELSLATPSLSGLLDVKGGRNKCQYPDRAIPVTTKRIPESPKRPRHYAPPLNEYGDMNSESSNERNNLFSSSPLGDSGNQSGKVRSKSKVPITPLLCEDKYLPPLFYEPPELSNPDTLLQNGRYLSTENNKQLVDSPVCSTPASPMGSISVNGCTPESILRTAAKNFKNTPSIIRKRVREASKQESNSNESNGICTPEVRSGSSNDTQGSAHSCNGQEDLTSKDLLSMNWLSLSSPSLHNDINASFKSVEKRLEHAFDLEWDNSKARCSSATESDSNDGNIGTYIALHNSSESSIARSNENLMLLDFGLNCNPMT
ncbi:hypothetical protein IFM89_037386 [Coptis chinensis]|uniref:Uncharacterized protein n=1 Tax=Coptis chinensis TaxID=261450 RepID=A0A835M8E4_9MAGN|nr:hypothetical protein IFM89_037386 [Coptis chinensis]